MRVQVAANSTRRRVALGFFACAVGALALRVIITRHHFPHKQPVPLQAPSAVMTIYCDCDTPQAKRLYAAKKIAPIFQADRRGPFNDPPPLPIDPRTKRPIPHYICVPGATYAMPDDAQPHWRCDEEKIGGWSTVGRVKITITPEDAAAIKKQYNANVTSGTTIDTAAKAAEITLSCARYVDHYRGGADGKTWIYTGSERYQRDGRGNIFTPAWYGSRKNCKTSDGPAFGAEYQTGRLPAPKKRPIVFR